MCPPPFLCSGLALRGGEGVSYYPISLPGQKARQTDRLSAPSEYIYTINTRGRMYERPDDVIFPPDN